MAASAGPWSFPSGQSAAFNPSIRRVQASGDESGAPAGKRRVQPSGKFVNGPACALSSVFSRRIRV